MSGSNADNISAPGLGQQPTCSCNNERRAFMLQEHSRAVVRLTPYQFSCVWNQMCHRGFGGPTHKVEMVQPNKDITGYKWLQVSSPPPSPPRVLVHPSLRAHLCFCFNKKTDCCYSASESSHVQSWDKQLCAPRLPPILDILHSRPTSSTGFKEHPVESPLPELV